MRSSRLEPEEVRCSCGRLTAHATAASYASTLVRYVYRRCQCGHEWTERLQTVDRTIPVTFDEVLDVHERLTAFKGPLTELLGLEKSA